MSKSKTKRARREAKREHAKKLSKATHASKLPSKPTNPQPPAKKQKHKPNAQATRTTNTHTDVTNPKSMPHTQASQRHDIPFGVYDRILLVGEGDFSFTRSLAIEHGCASVTGTSYDSEQEVRDKYPTLEAIKRELSELTPPVPILHGIDATKISTYKSLRNIGSAEDTGDNEGNGDEEGERGYWDIIAFMFSHTGGLSTDVNRQVRANQALLVSFFKSCLEISDSTKQKDKKSKSRTPATPFLKMGGRVIVTLFEGEPYTLWNIRDLARHSGLKVLESFKFDWTEYPGYKHVRTLGTIEGGGAWKGEEREARMYVFEKVPLEPDSEEEREKEAKRAKKGKKRGREEDSESDDDD